GAICARQSAVWSAAPGTECVRFAAGPREPRRPGEQHRTVAAGRGAVLRPAELQEPLFRAGVIWRRAPIRFVAHRLGELHLCPHAAAAGLDRYEPYERRADHDRWN